MMLLKADGPLRLTEMNKKCLTLLMILITLFLVLSLYAADKKTLLEELKQHEARSEATWREFIGKEINDRIVEAPDIIVDYLRKDNKLNGYEDRPYSVKPDGSFLEDIKSAVDALPWIVKNQIKEHVIALFLVLDLGTTGYVEMLRNFKENRLGFIVFDIDYLNQKANDWISWREMSPFKGRGDHLIRIIIEENGNDHRRAAIQYILLHEVGHIIGITTGSHPSWFSKSDPGEWPFTKLSWAASKQESKVISRHDGTFINRSRLKYYAFKNALLAADDVAETVRQWLTTDFVSLYAATNPYDDFAETYAMYVHVLLQNRPWKLMILNQGIIKTEVASPILDKRCESKKQHMDILFKR